MSLPQICIVCKETSNVVQLLPTSLDRLLKFTESWSKIGQYNELHEILLSSESNELYYHPKCSNMVTHKSHLERAQKAYSEKAAKENKENQSFSLCFLCQQPNGPLSKVKTEVKGQQILEIKNGSEDLKIRLASINTPADVINNELRYHNRCLQRELRQSETIRTVESVEQWNRHEAN